MLGDLGILTYWPEISKSMRRFGDFWSMVKIFKSSSVLMIFSKSPSYCTCLLLDFKYVTFHHVEQIQKTFDDFENLTID